MKIITGDRPVQRRTHGTNSGYKTCHCCDCRRAHAESLRRFRSGRSDKILDATGCRRRLQALQALGWSSSKIGRVAGINPGSIQRLLRAQQVRSSTAALVGRAYDDLSMKVGPSTAVRELARRKGWPPPLAWDDDTIDRPDAVPHGALTTRSTRSRATDAVRVAS